jgi:hypothetical protein
MTAAPRLAQTPHLDATWIERQLTVTIEQQTVLGTVRANWGTLHVAVTSPVANLWRVCDERGWSFAMLCHHRPESRFALDGELTAHGLERAKELLAGVYLDWLAVSRHGDAVAAACRDARRELGEVDRQTVDRGRAPRQDRLEQRKRFQKGELTQIDYQRSLKTLKESLGRLDEERRQAIMAVQERFREQMVKECGRAIALDEAERFLTEVAVVVATSPV